MTRASIYAAAILLSHLFAAGVVGAREPRQPQSSASDQRSEATRILKQAATFYREQVATHGGYVYFYSSDLTQRWGEGAATPDTIFVQPPGTPTVGMAYLSAFETTGDRFYLDAARETAEALVYGQLESGGWTQTIHFGPAERLGKYRNGNGGDWNASSLDDDQTQAALRMLMLADRAHDFEHAEIHEAASYGLDALLAAQFPNGGFPQVWKGPVEPQPVLEAKYPDYDWRTEGRIKNYWDYYTLNDGLAGTIAQTLITAHQVYQDEKYLNSLRQLGDFLMLAQMPAPQPAWCQQYNYDMVPMWARKFEPPAIAGAESQDVIETLMEIARYSGDERYLEPIPRALDYLESCLLPDSKLARFYELRTNRPLFMDARYQLTYDDAAAPSHYGWKHSARLKQLKRRYREALDNGGPERIVRDRAALEKDVRRIIDAIDDQGRWVTVYAGERLTGQPKFSPGFEYISSAEFSRNVETLSEYIQQ